MPSLFYGSVMLEINPALSRIDPFNSSEEGGLDIELLLVIRVPDSLAASSPFLFFYLFLCE